MAALVDLIGKVAIDKRGDLDRELRFMRQADHVERWGRFRGKLAYGADGNPRTLRGTLEDISERKEAEAKLQESSNLLQIFVHDAPTGLAMFDHDLRYISASRRWIEDHGLKEWDYIGRRHFELGYKIPDRWKEHYSRSLAGETVSFSEDWYEVEDGSKRWVRRMVRPWMTGRGAVGGIVVLCEDITERKLAEEALRESEESLKEAQRIVRIGSYVLDISTGFWTSSEALNDIFGVDAGYHRSVDGWKALIHPDDRAMMSSHLADEVLSKANRFSKEYRIVRPGDHAVRWVQGLGKLEFDAQGKLVRLRGTIQDITERKQADASLHESRELPQLFIKHAPAAIAMFDREMRYVSASRRWLESYLLEGQELTGRRHYEVFPDIPQRWREAHRRGIAGQGIRMEEDRFDRIDGTVQWLRWEIIPWTDSDGRIGGIVLFTEDITAQKEIAERLKLAANVFTHASEGIVITDPQGAILDANEAFTRITGYERAEVLGRNPRILQSGRHGREFYVQMWEQLTAQGHWSGEVWNRAKSGQIYAETLTISAVPDEAGMTQQFVAMFSDITSMKEKEQELKQVAHFDLLTGLPNRVLLEDRLRQAMAQAHRLRSIVAVAYFDLDD
jgi:PAS domain S-box-containing protein